MIASRAQESSVGIFGGCESVINQISERKKVDQVLRGAFLPTKKNNKGKGKCPNARKGQAKKLAAGAEVLISSSNFNSSGLLYSGF